MANVSSPRSIFSTYSSPRLHLHRQTKSSASGRGFHYLIVGGSRVHPPRKRSLNFNLCLLPPRSATAFNIRSIFSPPRLRRSPFTRKWRRKIHSSFKFDRASQPPYWLESERAPRSWLDAENALSNDVAAHAALGRAWRLTLWAP